VGERKAAGPGECPVRQGRLVVVGLDLDGAPERQDLPGEMEPDRFEAGDRSEVRVAQDERAGCARGAGSTQRDPRLRAG